MLTDKILIGCDPEVFATNKETGEFVSAHGLIPGNKQEPHPVALGAVQVDGMAFEFNTDPAESREEFIRNVTGVYKTLEEMLPPALSLAHGVPVAKFTSEVYKAQPIEALELGCEPDYNAYTGEENPRPEASDEAAMRTAAGHIHIGFSQVDDPFDAGHMAICNDLIKTLDVWVGLWSLSYDKDTERRSLYGQAGAYRPKTYGAEYRVLSNAWLKRPELIGSVYERTEFITSAFLQGLRFDPEMCSNAQGAINTSDERLAQQVLTQAKRYI